MRRRPKHAVPAADVSPRPSRVVAVQQEFALPGSRLSHDEALFLEELRRLREQLAKR